MVAWRSSWVVDGAAAFTESEASDGDAASEQGGEGVVRFEASIASPVVLKCPPHDDDEQAANDGRAQMPCELTVEWTPTPRRCRSLRLEVLASARHVELFVEGTRRNLLGEREHGEVYFGTFRGGRSSDDPQRYAISEQFDQRSGEHNVLGSVMRLRVKFVSLVGDKRELQLHAFRCVYDAIPDAPAPAAPATPIPSDVASTLAGLNIGGGPMLVNTNPTTPSGISSVQLLLASAQQNMMQQMEAKIAGAIDAKLALLSQRLTFSEQQIFKLHQRIDSTDSEQKACVNRLQDRLASLEANLATLGKREDLSDQQQEQQPAE